MAALTSLGGRMVTVSDSERVRRMGSKDLADWMRYWERASRLMMALRVRAGRPLRSMSMEVAVGEDDDDVDGGGAAWAWGGGKSGLVGKRRDDARIAEVAAVTSGRAKDVRGSKKVSSSLSSR